MLAFASMTPPAKRGQHKKGNSDDGFTNSIVLRERLQSTGIIARRRQSGGLAILIPSHATLRKFRSAGLEAVKRTRLGVCFRDILRLDSPFLVADASARQRAKYNQQQRLCHGTTLPLTQSLDVSAIFVSEMWIHELKISSTHDSRGRSLVSIVRGVENLRARRDA
jgi:hypothetical protein